MAGYNPYGDATNLQDAGVLLAEAQAVAGLASGGCVPTASSQVVRVFQSDWNGKYDPTVAPFSADRGQLQVDGVYGAGTQAAVAAVLGAAAPSPCAALNWPKGAKEKVWIAGHPDAPGHVAASVTW